MEDGKAAAALAGPGNVFWSALNGSVDQLSVRGCPLRRFSHAEAVQCLASKRLVFVGDSITRYQYLTLLHFLDRGEWPHPTGNQPGQPSVANEHEWASWNAFLRGTSRLFGGRELCDCYREDLFEYFDPRFRRFVTWKPPEDEKFENRHYRSGNISVSHFTFTTEPNTVHGHFGFPPYENGRKPCKPAACRAAADWSYRLVDALRKPVAAMQPTHLVLNSGLWGSSNAFGNKTWQNIARAGRTAVAAQQGRAIWRTTTASLGKNAAGRDHDKLALAHTTAAGWGVLDAWAITSPLLQLPPIVRPLWDPRHFTAVVYRELNQYLLNMICPTPAAS
ncbi:hypothetical protein COHA_005834 [Chlorella ohadii]|uniref:PC-Esterase n=1 Tax=Chlorella ohadii TaxID=2649997 RepID=A0AAD5DQ10_9CHLO|nr:hypothetical protein COHA_005834 [Chlorella ohadii]